MKKTMCTTLLLPTIASILLLSGEVSAAPSLPPSSSSQPCTVITSWNDFATTIQAHQDKELRKAQRREEKLQLQLQAQQQKYPKSRDEPLVEEESLPMYKILPDPILLCPFHITHDGDEEGGVDVVIDNTHILCYNEKWMNSRGGDTAGDGGAGGGGDEVSIFPVKGRCVISGNGRHMNIQANGVVLMGFDFYGSEYGAMVVDGNGGTVLDCGFYE